jgi:p-cumate 2,3-dioxygenase beta subunit
MMPDAVMDRTSFTRSDVEDFLYREAALLDEWRLGEWIELFADNASYIVPTNDRPDGDVGEVVVYIADDKTRLKTRVDQILAGTNWAMNPRSRTRHVVSNVRITGSQQGMLSVAANFIVYHFRFSNTDAFVGRYEYKFAVQRDGLKITERKAILDQETLSPHGKIAFIL